MSCYIFLVADNAESIDNPMHEAAKRGTTHIYIYIFINLVFCVFYKLNHLFRVRTHKPVSDFVHLNRKPELVEGVSGEQGWN